MLHNIKFNNVRMDAQEHAQQLRDASRIIESLNTYIVTSPQQKWFQDKHLKTIRNPIERMIGEGVSIGGNN